jgi:hypothetical protein
MVVWPSAAQQVVDDELPWFMPNPVAGSCMMTGAPGAAVAFGGQSVRSAASVRARGTPPLEGV